MAKRIPRAPHTRFDGDSVRRILEDAAAEQQRIDNVRADTYTLAELEELAAELRVSPAALETAIEAEARGADAGGTGHAPPRRRWLPAHWSAPLKDTLVMGSAFVALTAGLLGLWAVAPAFFWATALSLVAVSLVILLGGAPF